MAVHPQCLVLIGTFVIIILIGVPTVLHVYLFDPSLGLVVKFPQTGGVFIPASTEVAPTVNSIVRFYSTEQDYEYQYILAAPGTLRNYPSNQGIGLTSRGDFAMDLRISPNNPDGCISPVLCTFTGRSVLWDGQIPISCPPGCASAGGTVNGTGPFSVESSLCLSAIYAGLLDAAKGGTFMFEFDGVHNSFPGNDSAKHNVTALAQSEASYGMQLFEAPEFIRNLTRGDLVFKTPTATPLGNTRFAMLTIPDARNDSCSFFTKSLNAYRMGATGHVGSIRPGLGESIKDTLIAEAEESRTSFEFNPRYAGDAFLVVNESDALNMFSHLSGNETERVYIRYSYGFERVALDPVVIDATTGILPDLLISQYASNVYDCSGCGKGVYNSMGAPDTTCGAHGVFGTAGAWQPSSGYSSITLSFEEAVYATRMNLWETHQPGGVVEIEIYDSASNQYRSVWSDYDKFSCHVRDGTSREVTNGGASFRFPVQPFLSNRVRVHVFVEDSFLGGSDIDAAVLVGFPSNTTVDVTGKQCRPACHHREGICVNGTCVCEDGFGGASCSRKVGYLNSYQRYQPIGSFFLFGGFWIITALTIFRLAKMGHSEAEATNGDQGDVDANTVGDDDGDVDDGDGMDGDDKSQKASAPTAVELEVFGHADEDGDDEEADDERPLVRLPTLHDMELQDEASFSYSRSSPTPNHKVVWVMYTVLFLHALQLSSSILDASFEWTSQGPLKYAAPISRVFGFFTYGNPFMDGMENRFWQVPLFFVLLPYALLYLAHRLSSLSLHIGLSAFVRHLIRTLTFFPVYSLFASIIVCDISRENEVPVASTDPYGGMMCSFTNSLRHASPYRTLMLMWPMWVFFSFNFLLLWLIYDFRLEERSSSVGIRDTVQTLLSYTGSSPSPSSPSETASSGDVNSFTPLLMRIRARYILILAVGKIVQAFAAPVFFGRPLFLAAAGILCNLLCALEAWRRPPFLFGRLNVVAVAAHSWGASLPLLAGGVAYYVDDATNAASGGVLLGMLMFAVVLTVLVLIEYFSVYVEDPCPANVSYMLLFPRVSSHIISEREEIEVRKSLADVEKVHILVGRSELQRFVTGLHHGQQVKSTDDGDGKSDSSEATSPAAARVQTSVPADGSVRRAVFALVVHSQGQLDNRLNESWGQRFARLSHYMSDRSDLDDDLSVEFVIILDPDVSSCSNVRTEGKDGTVEMEEKERVEDTATFKGQPSQPELLLYFQGKEVFSERLLTHGDVRKTIRSQRRLVQFESEQAFERVVDVFDYKKSTGWRYWLKSIARFGGSTYRRNYKVFFVLIGAVIPVLDVLVIEKLRKTADSCAVGFNLDLESFFPYYIGFAVAGVVVWLVQWPLLWRVETGEEMHAQVKRLKWMKMFVRDLPHLLLLSAIYAIVGAGTTSYISAVFKIVSVITGVGTAWSQANGRIFNGKLRFLAKTILTGTVVLILLAMFSLQNNVKEQPVGIDMKNVRFAAYSWGSSDATGSCAFLESLDLESHEYTGPAFAGRDPEDLEGGGRILLSTLNWELRWNVLVDMSPSKTSVSNIEGAAFDPILNRNISWDLSAHLEFVRGDLFSDEIVDPDHPNGLAVSGIVVLYEEGSSSVVDRYERYSFLEALVSSGFDYPVGRPGCAGADFEFEPNDCPGAYACLTAPSLSSFSVRSFTGAQRAFSVMAEARTVTCPV